MGVFPLSTILWGGVWGGPGFGGVVLGVFLGVLGCLLGCRRPGRVFRGTVPGWCLRDHAGTPWDLGGLHARGEPAHLSGTPLDVAARHARAAGQAFAGRRRHQSRENPFTKEKILFTLFHLFGLE